MGVQVVVYDDEDDEEERPSGLAGVVRRFSVAGTTSVGVPAKRGTHRRSIAPRPAREHSWGTVTAATAPARLAQEGARLCAKAQRSRERRVSQSSGPVDVTDIPAMWPGARSVSYSVHEVAGGHEEVLLGPGSPIGELAFFGETESHTVRPPRPAPAMPDTSGVAAARKAIHTDALCGYSANAFCSHSAEHLRMHASHAYVDVGMCMRRCMSGDKHVFSAWSSLGCARAWPPAQTFGHRRGVCRRSRR